MTFSAEERYDLVMDVCVYPGQQITADGDFEIIWANRGAGRSMEFSYCARLDILMKNGTTITILENGREVRQYNAS